MSSRHQLCSKDLSSTIILSSSNSHSLNCTKIIPHEFFIMTFPTSRYLHHLSSSFLACASSPVFLRSLLLTTENLYTSPRYPSSENNTYLAILYPTAATIRLRMRETGFLQTVIGWSAQNFSFIASFRKKAAHFTFSTWPSARLTITMLWEKKDRFWMATPSSKTESSRTTCSPTPMSILLQKHSWEVLSNFDAVARCNTPTEIALSRKLSE